MNFKKLEKAAHIYEQIKRLDAQIIEIDRLAMLVANGEIKASFVLTIEDMGKQKEDAQKVGFDEDGSLIRKDLDRMYERMKMSFLGYAFTTGYGVDEKENKHEHSLTSGLTENTTLQILGVLLGEKQANRRELIKQIETLQITF